MGETGAPVAANVVVLASVGAVGAATPCDPEVVGALVVGVGRSGATAVAGELVAAALVVAGVGDIKVVGVPPGLVAAGDAGWDERAFDFESLGPAFGQRALPLAGRAFARRLGHATWVARADRV